MKVLVLGGSSREHAIVWKLSQSRHIDKIYCCPGNAGISGIAECIDVSPNDIDALIDFVKYEWIDLTLASCQHYEQGYFVAHRHLAAENPGLVAFVGDYIYERSRKGNTVRTHNTDEPKTLAGYRDRYVQYRTDADLQAAHACAPWLVTWDDHEVANDYANDRAEDLDPAFLARRASAYRAYFEHMPLRPSVLRADGETRIYGTHAWGDLATLHVLDDRQYRAHQACPRAGRGGSNTVGSWCTDRLASGRTMLGADQETSPT